MVQKFFSDWIQKGVNTLLGNHPKELIEMRQYFKTYGAIQFDFHQEDGMQIAVSTNFRYGSIVTFAKTGEKLDEKIKDAILTSFKIPSSYSKEAAIRREGAESIAAYAAA